MFVIVKTVENGKVYVTAVPSSWVQNGTLFWPNVGVNEAIKMRSNQNIVPSEGWGCIPCEVKKTNIPTFEQAFSNEKEYCIFSDTESEAMYVLILLNFIL